LDEAINVLAATNKSPFDLLTKYSLGDFHPPLYHVILYFWIKFFGNSEIAVRLPSVIFGLLTIYLTFLISELVFNNKTISLFKHKLSLKFLPALFLTFSGLHLYYSQEARMYSLAAFLTTLAIYVHLIKSHSLIRIVSIVLLLLSDYVPWLLMPVFFWLSPVTTFAGLLATIPWWPFLVKQLALGMSTAADFPLWNQVVGRFSIKNILLIPIKFLYGRVSVTSKISYFLLFAPGVVTSSLLIAANYLKLKQQPKIIKVITAWFLVPLIIGVVLSLKISLLSYFRFIFILPAFYILLVWAINTLTGKYKGWLVTGFFCLTVITGISYLLLPQFHREDWRSFSLWIDIDATPNSLTIFPSLAQADPYYYYQHKIPAADTLDINQLPETVYLVRYVQEIFDPQDKMRQNLESLGFVLMTKKSFNGVVVWKYHKPKFYAKI
jgi:hypothetical protein